MAIADVLECTIDFEGQKLSETLTKYIVVVAAAIGFIAGYALQNLQITLSIFGIGIAAALIIILPPWPMYNRHQLSWQKKTH